ncbi:MAG TPA: methyltransferase domain-containing protein [Polyangia bacterium]|jgi:SAM-dependent methyltransferase|nr:methyltransferase domain-containing protein [Polyangia bacterium]
MSLSSGPRTPDKHERLARVYDTEVWPLFGQHFAQMLLRSIKPRPRAAVLEVGAATGATTAELLRRFDGQSRITAVDQAPLIALARRRLEADAKAAARATLVPGSLPLPFPAASFDVVLSHPTVGDETAPADLVAELARVLRPGGQLSAGFLLRGTWTEFLDIYRDVLEENKKADSLTALGDYINALPDGEAAARLLEQAGLEKVEVSVQRWELLFKSAREFFFAAAIELGPLSRWKQMAGRGEEMQDIFFFVKEAIDAYFADGAFAVTVVAGCVKGWKPKK